MLSTYLLLHVVWFHPENDLAYLAVRLYRHSRTTKNIEGLRPIIRGLVRISLLKIGLMVPIV
jgi:hypothetical protein